MPNEPRFTPGPWRWVTNLDSCWLRSEASIARDSCPDFDGLDPIADDGSAGGEHGRTIEPDSPNAHLIAAAPDLYEALDLMMRGGESWLIVSTKARAALAKARGDSVPVQSPGDHQESNPGPQGGQSNAK